MSNRFSRQINLLFFLFFFLLSCNALKKNEDGAEIFSEIPLDSSIQNALSQNSFVIGDWPALNWWETFEDGQLNQMMEQAILGNPNLQNAIARMHSTRENARKVGSRLYPHLDLALEDNYQHLSKDSLYRFPPSPIPAVINQIDLTLNFSYEIDLFGKNREAYLAALGEAKAQKAEMSQSLLIITTLLAESYFNFQANSRLLDSYKEIVSEKQKFLTLIEKRKKYGLDNEIEYENAATAFFEAEQMVLELEKKIALNRSEIKILMGLGPDADFEFEKPIASFTHPFTLPEDIPLNLLSRRPDLMAQIWRVEAAAHKISAAKAAFFPNINLIAFAGLESLSWAQLLRPSNFSASLAPAIYLPIFTGGRLTAELEQSRADFDAAVFSYNTLLLRASKEVADQITILLTYISQNKLQSEIVEKNRRSAQLESDRYQNGVTDYLKVIEANIKVLNQSIIQINLQNDRYQSSLHLIRALGGGYNNGG